MQRKATLSALLTGAGCLLGSFAIAQTARVQVIHNCADAAASVVDVYVNGGAEPLIDDFAFRTATPFTVVPAGVDLEIGIAPGNSTGPNDIIPGLTFTFNLADGESYVLVANGIVSGSGYTPAPAFELSAFAGAREAAGTAGNTDILVMHGSTDAPTVQVAETAALGGAVVVSPFSYGDFNGSYLEVPTGDYVLEVQLPDGTPVVAYDAPLATLGLDDAALVAVASGFLAPGNNSDGPAFGIWVALPTGGDLVELPVAEDATARLQVIHNCADAAASVVDVYVNGGVDPLIDDFAFRTATSFIDVPAGVDLEIGIAPGNSAGPQDIIPGLTFTYNLADGGSYILVANGIVSATGYSPAPAFGLDVFPLARETASMMGNTDVLVMHGSTDAPVVDVAETSVPAGTVVDDLAYGEFAGYLELGTADYVIEVQTADGTPVQAYQAPLATLNLDGTALTVLASGFLNPAVNSDGPAFGLWVALPGGGDLVELPVVIAPPTASIQVIHNCADAAASTVDIYVNGGASPFIDDLDFRTATAFTDVPAGVDLEIGIAPGTSTGPQDIIPGLSFTFNLEVGGSYIIVANGIVSATGYSPAPAFDLDVYDAAREAANMMGNTDVLVMHGSTDAPVVDVAELALLGGATIVDDLAYGDFAGYLEVPTADYALQVRTSDGTPVVTYSAPLATLGLDDVALTVLASGFLTPANNSNGPAFGLYVALPAGGALVPLAVITNVGLAEGLENATLAAWPNPASDELNVSINTTQARNIAATLVDMAGRRVLDVPTTDLIAGENRLRIGLNDVPAGAYTLRIVDETRSASIPVHVVR